MKGKFRVMKLMDTFYVPEFLIDLINSSSKKKAGAENFFEFDHSSEYWIQFPIRRATGSVFVQHFCRKRQRSCCKYIEKVAFRDAALQLQKFKRFRKFVLKDRRS